jgi:hypothetical protein
MRFQIGNSARNVGGGGVQLSRGSGEAACLCDATEGAHVLQSVHWPFSGEMANCDMKLLTHVSHTKGLSSVR